MYYSRKGTVLWGKGCCLKGNDSQTVWPFMVGGHSWRTSLYSCRHRIEIMLKFETTRTLSATMIWHDLLCQVFMTDAKTFPPKLTYKQLVLVTEFGQHSHFDSGSEPLLHVILLMFPHYPFCHCCFKIPMWRKYL